MLFSIIIINYRQKDFLNECVKSIQNNLKSEYEIIVVNNSPDKDIIEIENVTVINNSNKGFSHANNLASQKANGEYLFFLNADTLLQKDFSESFLEEFKNREFGVAGIGLRFPDERYQLSFWHENNLFGELKNKRLENSFTNNYKSVNYSGIDSVKEVNWVSGAAMIIKKDVYEKVGGFDEDYFLFYEDADICKRINDIGFQIYYFPFDGLIHYKGENVNVSFSADTYYYSKKSQLIYYKKHNNILNRFLIRFYLLLKSLIKVITKRDKINVKILKLVLGVSYD